MGTEWGSGGEPMGKGEHHVAVKSRSSDASRSEGGSSASKLGVVSAQAAAPVAPENEAAKKKRTPKFLTKQFEILTKSSSGTSPRRNRGVNLLGQDYIIPVPGSRAVTATTNATATTSATATASATTTTANLDPKPDDRSTSNDPAEPSTGAVTPNHRPPIEFVTAPIDYKAEAQRRAPTRVEPPLDFITERSPRISPRISPRMLSTRTYASAPRSHWSHGRSPSGSERLSFSRSERSVLSIPETVIPSDDHSRGSVQTASRSTSPSSLAEWSSHSLDHRGELSIAGLSLGEGRNISRRTDLSIGQSPGAQTLDYGPDDTDSGVEMYHETTSASPGSYSPRRSSCSLSEDWIPECEDSDGASHHQFRRSRRRGTCVSAYSRSPSRSASSSRRQFESSHGKMRHFYDRSRRNTSNHSSQRHHADKKSTNVDELLRRHARRRGPVALGAMNPQEAIAVFHDEVARMMLEEGHECGEAADVEEFLDGYMRLRSPFYVAMVDEFFRAVCVDCYKRPVEVPHANSGSLSSKSLRSDRPVNRFNTRM